MAKMVHFKSEMGEFWARWIALRPRWGDFWLENIDFWTELGVIFRPRWMTVKTEMGVFYRNGWRLAKRATFRPMVEIEIENVLVERVDCCRLLRISDDVRQVSIGRDGSRLDETVDVK